MHPSDREGLWFPCGAQRGSPVGQVRYLVPGKVERLSLECPLQAVSACRRLQR